MRFPLAAVVLVVVVAVGRGQGPASFPAAKHGGGELRYVSGVPVLTVRGTPAEIGEQFGVLAVKNAPDIDGLRRRFLQSAGQADKEWLVTLLSRRLRAGIPADHLAEMTAAAAAGGQPPDTLLFANTVYDLSGAMGCSTLVLDGSRTAGGRQLFGRNFDWTPVPGISEHTLVVVARPVGKRAFALITVAPIAGCITGMNSAGLCVALNQVFLKRAKDQAAFDWGGTPTMLLFRRVLEECGTVAEAETLLRGSRRTTAAGLTACDGVTAAVFEMTPKSFAVRGAVNGTTCCTNHFRTAALAGDDRPCARMPKLLAAERAGEKLGVADVFAKLDEVHQGKLTLQAMVFEPAARVLHLKYGDGPATRLKAVRLELGKMFE